MLCRLRRSLLPAGILISWAGGCGEATSSQIVRADSAGIFVVTSAASDVTLEWSFDSIFSLGGEEEGPESFYELSRERLATDEAGRIHVLDIPRRQVITFSPEGSFIRTFGREGGGPGEFQVPLTVAATASGDVSVFDRRKLALVRWDSSGAPLPMLPFPHWPFEGGRHHALTAGGYLVLEATRPRDWSNRLLEVRNGDTRSLGVTPSLPSDAKPTRACGGVVSFPPLFTPVIQWDYRDGTVALTPGDGYRVDVWRGGKLIRSIRRDFPVANSSEELAAVEVGEAPTFEIGGENCTVPMSDFVEAKGWVPTVPAIRRLALASDGSLWVERNVPGVHPGLIDVFSPDGGYRGTLPEGTEFPVLFLARDRAAFVVRDQWDVDRLLVAEVRKPRESN